MLLDRMALLLALPRDGHQGERYSFSVALIGH
jgi:hypothetical protein